VVAEARLNSTGRASQSWIDEFETVGGVTDSARATVEERLLD